MSERRTRDSWLEQARAEGYQEYYPTIGSGKAIDGIPCRSRMDRMTIAELAILEAVQAIEVMGCDTRLSNAQVLLQQARDMVADFVDGVATVHTPAQQPESASGAGEKP